MISITDDFRRICSARQASQIRKGKRGKKRKHILKYLIFSKWLFYFTATSTVYCHNEMLWGYILTSSSSTFDIKRESIGEKHVSQSHTVTSTKSLAQLRGTSGQRWKPGLAADCHSLKSSVALSLWTVGCWMLVLKEYSVLGPMGHYTTGGLAKTNPLLTEVPIFVQRCKLI